MARQVRHPEDGQLVADELRFIAGALRHMYEGPTWHGPSVREALDGVNAGDAAARNLPGVHTIFEIAHHIAAWVGEVERRLRGAEPGDPQDGDFPVADTVVDEAMWNTVRARVEGRHHSLIEAVLGFQDSRLGERVGSDLNAQLGTGGSYREMLRGVIEHDAYHAGQIVLLRKGLIGRANS